MEILDLLDRWVQVGWLRELDRAFARFLAQEVTAAHPLLLLAAALASHQLGRGHACLDLEAAVGDAREVLAIPPESQRQEPAPGKEAIQPAQYLTGLSAAEWLAALNEPALIAEGEGTSPLVLVGQRLYLRRYWQYEQTVRAGLEQRLVQDEPMDAAWASEVRTTLEALFPADPSGNTDWQKVACAMALRTRFTLVTGGPGTGKTTTVVKLLALLQHLALREGGRGRALRIRLAAPTGKAAARLTSSIVNAVHELRLDQMPHAGAVRAAIPTDVSTVHRLLAALGGARRYRHDADNPLPLDVLVLDEASMVDLEMMAGVFEALPPHARLIMLGDKDQLASVEAGNVLGELCSRADAGHYRNDTRTWLRAVSGEHIPVDMIDADGRDLDQAVVKLRRSWRFDASSGIGRLAEAVNSGDLAAVGAIRKDGAADVAWHDLDANDRILRSLVLDGAPSGFQAGGQGRGIPAPVGYRHYLEQLKSTRPTDNAAQEAFDAWARRVLNAFGSFQLLCAVRQGPQGVETLNRRIASLLHAEKLVPSAQGWYVGRPVMVTRNDYTLGLMNGDVGVTLERPALSAEAPLLRKMLRVAFADANGGIRWVLPSRLRDVETVFAMTVHKSQGSEFTHAALLLPEGGQRVLTRELVYTAMTRAKSWLTLALPPGSEAMHEAIARRTRRTGGLLTGLGPTAL